MKKIDPGVPCRAPWLRDSGYTYTIILNGKTYMLINESYHKRADAEKTLIYDVKKANG